MNDLVAIARIARPRGIKGEVVADLLTDFPERFEGLQSVIAVLLDGSRIDLEIERSWLSNGRIVFKFLSFDSNERAEALRGAEICVDETDAVELGDDEYYDWQLVGCDVHTATNEAIGMVTGVLRTGGTEILVVASSKKEYLIPFARTICTEVDIEGKNITIDPPEGLLEF
ncbi:MAG TPA: ribosome maturation factor RimM [Pyrinomonadaceae bacterium]|nr:ribosome maturation factor RimM [Pyrinomonadaceae bacterium]HMP64723.1 ribosome maturation factor RimM [Pyrinomonadaceae bacterium]